MDETMAKALREPFAGDAVGKLPKVTCKACADRDKDCARHNRKQCRTCNAYVGQHIHIDFVGHAHVTERLNEVDPDWNWEPVALDHDGLPLLSKEGGLWIRLTVGGKTVLGYGDAPGKRAATKELIGDAIRNAAMRFGVALDMWKKEPTTTVVVDDAPVALPSKPEEVRRQITLLGKTKKLSLDQVAADFHQWSKGSDLRSADLAVLVEYRDYLQNKEASRS